MFPAGCAVVVSDGSGDPPMLEPVEAHAVRNAIATRQREFAVGRWCARRAMARLGVAPRAIPVAANRAPVWPAGVVGSITHCKGFVGAVVAPTTALRSIGFDAERAEPLKPDLVRLICTPQETAWAARQPRDAGVDWPKVIFSAKEALHKCISPVFGTMLDFVDVTLDIDAANLEFSARLARPAANVDLSAVRGRFAFSDTFVFACAFIPSSDGAET